MSLQDLQKNLIFSLSKSPEIVLKDSKNRKVKDFHSYVKKLDNSMTKYQLTYVPPRGILNYEEKKGPNAKFMDINDRKLIKKMMTNNGGFQSNYPPNGGNNFGGGGKKYFNCMKCGRNQKYGNIYECNF